MCAGRRQISMKKGPRLILWCCGDTNHLVLSPLVRPGLCGTDHPAIGCKTGRKKWTIQCWLRWRWGEAFTETIRKRCVTYFIRICSERVSFALNPKTILGNIRNRALWFIEQRKTRYTLEAYRVYLYFRMPAAAAIIKRELAFTFRITPRFVADYRKGVKY